MTDDNNRELAGAVNAAPSSPAADGAGVSEDDLARILYEAEYDADAYPWEKQSSAEQLTYKTQAEAALRKFSIRHRSMVSSTNQRPPDPRGNYEDRHPNDLVLHPLTEIREWDEALAVLGIQDSDQTPADAIRERDAEIERLRAELSSVSRPECKTHD